MNRKSWLKNLKYLSLCNQLSLRKNAFIVIIIEGKIEGRRRRGRLRITYKFQIKEKVKVTSHGEVKELCDRGEWRNLYRQEHGSEIELQ